MKDAHPRMSPSAPTFFFCAVSILILPFLAMSQNITRLKIVVPVRNFTEFVSITTDPWTKETTYGGFAIEVFRAVLNNAVETPILFDFYSYPTKPDGTMNGTFDDMLRDVSSKKYDGAAGPISITYLRSELSDFTMPYLGTSISMLVRVSQPPTRNMGIPLGKVTKYVVVTSLAFSFIVALLFWILEYKNYKIATSPRVVNDDNWRREMLGSLTQTRLVMILFFMVLFVLIACYTASQTSSIAAQRQSGSFKNLNQLIRAKANVGYRQASFIHGLLKSKGIQESNLISLGSPAEMVEKLSIGTAQGGVDAIVADTPNLKILVANYCDVFTIVPTVNLHAAGFGFAFYPGFPQLSDVSNGILRLIDNGTLAKIQENTIGKLEGCQNDPPASAFLDSDSRWILIAGAVAVIILMTIILLFYCGMRGGNSNSNSNSNRRKKVVAFPCYLSPCS